MKRKPTATDSTIGFDLSELRAHYARWRQTVTGGCASGDKPRANQAIDRLYARCARERPSIFWCQSFYQMLTMPSLVLGILHSDMWDLIAGASISQATDKQWTRYWNKVWSEI